MRTAFDLAPLFRSTVGFDRVFDMIENASRLTSIDNWPPYDIVKTGEDDYSIAMAIAGFSPDELSITHEPNLLLVSGTRQAEDQGDYLYRGIAGRAFQRRFELADHLKVMGARLENGLLTIELKREIPEEMKPRRIRIAAGPALPKAEPRRIEAEKQAA